MCGFYGFVGFSDPQLGPRMASSIYHRGPDGEGSHHAPGLTMGMRRLSIIDIEGGQQPIYSEDRSIAIVYNGEVYNYVELAKELAALGHTFLTRSDTEVIVHAYEQWGAACLDRLNGMFAFCIHDARPGREQLFLARDRCGQKPLYYWADGGRLVFASEVKAILQCPLVPRAPNIPAIDAFLGLRYVPEPATLFEGIVTLPAAHSMTVALQEGHPATPQVTRYWDVELSGGGPYLKDAEYVEELDALLQDAVKIALRSDVPVAAYLSAGVDSSLLTALMCQHGQRVDTFSIGFNSPIDETRHAAQTASYLGTHHHETHCTPEDFDLLRKVIYHMDRPPGDILIIAFYKMAELVRSAGIKVVMGGEGADEMYAGYNFHRVIQLAESFHKVVPAPLTRHAIAPAIRHFPVGLLDKVAEFPASLGRRGRGRVADFLASYSRRSVSENYVALKTLWSLEERAALYSDDFAHLATRDWIPPVRDHGSPFLDRLLKLQYADWLQDWALIRQDKNTMAHSVEIRLPFLDHRLIEQAFRMPPHLKAKGTRDKIIERQIARRYLPPEVFNRPKNPFFFPVEFFFEHPQVARLIDDTLNPDAVRRRGYFNPDAVAALLAKMPSREFVTLKQVMSLVILELWHRIFIDGESP